MGDGPVNFFLSEIPEHGDVVSDGGVEHENILLYHAGQLVQGFGRYILKFQQRISIARSLLKKSSLLLADEATAALDARTAHQVSGDILDLDGITRIVVTHTLEESLLRRYDAILVLKNGRIVETGTFDELMARKEYFYALFTVSQ